MIEQVPVEWLLGVLGLLITGAVFWLRHEFARMYRDAVSLRAEMHQGFAIIHKRLDAAFLEQSKPEKT